jgi:hypothetical protein
LADGISRGLANLDRRRIAHTLRYTRTRPDQVVTQPAREAERSPFTRPRRSDTAASGLSITRDRAHPICHLTRLFGCRAGPIGSPQSYHTTLHDVPYDVSLEYLAASPRHGHGDANTVLAPVRSLATGLRVSKHRAHRALTVLLGAGLVESVQSRTGAGRFGAGCYRLAVSPAVVARVDGSIGECVLPAPPPRAASESGRVRAPRSRPPWRPRRAAAAASGGLRSSCLRSSQLSLRRSRSRQFCARVAQSVLAGSSSAQLPSKIACSGP